MSKAKLPKYILNYCIKRCKESNNEISTRKLALELVDKYADYFNSYESARGYVRFYREELNTNKPAKKDRVSEIVRSSRNPIVNKYGIPKTFAEQSTPFIIQRKKALILSDLHFPYHSPDEIEIALDYGVSRDMEAIIINGDLIDFATISRFDNDWRNRKLSEEFDAVREFLKNLRGHFPSTTIIYKEGNHDERWEKWLYSKAYEVFDDPEFRLDVRLRLAELNIQYVRDRSLMKMGKLYIVHGHEFIGGGGGGKNPAASMGNKFLGDILAGHFHKTSYKSEYNNTTGLNFNTYTTGCLSTLHPHYAKINLWNHGFAFVECDLVSGNYEVDNLKIINKKVVR
jgi:predicted phosphodiesterase